MAWQIPGWRERDDGRDEISSSLASEIEVETSVHGQTKAPASDDESWWLAVRLPASTLRSFTGRDIRIESDAIWRGNFYRSGVPDQQKATWNPLDTPAPMFHSPEYFGRIEFA